MKNLILFTIILFSYCYASSYYNREIAYIQKGEYDRTIADFDKALQIFPELADVYVDRGKAHYEKGDYDRAIANYDKTLQINPEDSLVYYNRGNRLLPER